MLMRKIPECGIQLFQTESKTLFNISELEKLLNSLPAIEQRVIIMFVQGFNSDEIAKILHIGKPQIATIVQRCCLLLKKAHDNSATK